MANIKMSEGSSWRTRNGTSQGTGVVDVDVHEALTSVEDLVPYLDEPWRSRVVVVDGWKGVPNFPYLYPQVGGVAMADAATLDGTPAGSSYDQMRDQLLDPYGVERAVLVSTLHPADMQVQPEFATALARAYNDWLIENWLGRDERLYGSITVAPQ